jgi:hypothetical protein
MAKRKRINNDLKNIHIKLKIDLHDNVTLPFFKQEPLMCKDEYFEFCYSYNNVTCRMGNKSLWVYIFVGADFFLSYYVMGLSLSSVSRQNGEFR